MSGNSAFDWDEANAEHIAAHDLTPDQVEQIFHHDETDMDYDVVNGEERWTVVGEIDDGKVLTVVYAVRKERIRVVTAYEAGRRARAAYLAARKSR